MIDYVPGRKLLTEEEALARDAERARRDAEDERSRRQKGMTLPARFVNARFGAWEKSSSAERACIEYLEQGWDKQGRLLVLWGPNGSGKTWAACALMNAMAESAAALPRFLSWTVPMIGDAADAWLRHAKERRLTVFDELGRQYLGKDEHSYASARVFEVLACRYEQVLPTILTTNMSPAPMAEVFGGALKSRLDSDWAIWRECLDRDYRRGQADRG